MLSVIMLNVTMKSVVAPKIKHNKFVMGPNSAWARCTKPDPCHCPATAQAQGQPARPIVGLTQEQTW